MKLTKKELKKKSEKISIQEGSAAGVMEGFGARYITPYALALGASNFIIALINTLPNLLGNITQLHTLKLMKKKTRKQIVATSVFVQSLLWILIISVGIFYLFIEKTGATIPILLLIIYSAMIIAGATASPAWNSWMKDIILSNNGRYFGARNRIVNFITIISMLIAGLILGYFKNGKLLFGFFIIFFIAFLGRLISAYLLTKQYEPKYVYDPSSYFSLKQFIKKMWFNNFGRFVIFVSLISLATAVAGPFFAVYMLEDLNFSYIQFTLVTISAIITTILFMPVWGRFSDKFGNIKVIKLTSLFIPIIPILWLSTVFLTSTDVIVVYLVLLELFSGFVWAGFNLSAATFIYDAVSKQKMAFCIAYFNILNSFGAFAGATIGGFMASHHTTFLNINPLVCLFIISGLLRFAIVVIMRNSIKEVRTVPDFKVKKHIKEKLREWKVVMWRCIGFMPIRIED